jgi:hypothetical protein
VDNATKLNFDLDDIEELVVVYEKAIQTRNKRETFVNETSSRSHLIFAIMIEMTKEGEELTLGKLTFIDLAGSESLAEIGVDPSRYIEGIQINESLKCLGRVINQ